MLYLLPSGHGACSPSPTDLLITQSGIYCRAILQRWKQRLREGKCRGQSHVDGRWQSWGFNPELRCLEELC